MLSSEMQVGSNGRGSRASRSPVSSLQSPVSVILSGLLESCASRFSRTATLAASEARHLLGRVRYSHSFPHTGQQLNLSGLLYFYVLLRRLDKALSLVPIG